MGAALVLLPSPPPSTPHSTASVTVTLTATGPTMLPQGRPFEVRVLAQNPDPVPVSVTVVLELGPVGGTDPPISFWAWKVQVPASGEAALDLEVPVAQWFASQGQFQVIPRIRGEPAGAPLALEVTAPSVVLPRFEDVTSAAGLSMTLPPPGCGMNGAGAAWGDIDRDGDLDLFVPVQGGSATLWVNDGGGRFEDEASSRGINTAATRNVSAVFADYDNDSDQDLLVVSYDAAHQLYRNDGSGHFVDIAASAGIAEATGGATASWGDYDGDGLLDLYVTNGFDCSSDPVDPMPDQLYRNEGGGRFSDQTALLPAEATDGSGFEAAWFDYDGDRDQDLYLANDYFGPDKDGNHLWRNDGAGPGDTWIFTDVTAASGTFFGSNSMGIGIGDYDRDLDLDFAVSDIAGNVLARNNGDGTFADVATDARAERVFQHAERSAITWGLGFYDVNLDGWEDLFVSGGALKTRNDQPDELFVNAGDGTFLDLSAPAAMVDPAMGRGVAFADFDRDGRVDLYQVNLSGSPVLYRNTTPRSNLHWLEVDTLGTIGNRDGCGTRLTVTVAAGTMIRQVFCGASLGSGSDPIIHFGLGAATTVKKLVVEWLSGRRQVFRNVAVDRLIEVTEPA